MKQRPVIGIEVSSTEVRGACVRQVAGAPQLTGVASVPTPPGSVDAEGLLDAQEIGDAIRRVCLQLDPKIGHVIVGMTGCNLVARVMEIPPVPEAEIRAVLRGEMDHYRILPAGQSAFDFYKLPDAGAGSGNEVAQRDGEVSRVLLIGAEERLVASYRAVVDASHLNLVAVEPGSIAIIRALYPLLTQEKCVATVSVTSTGTDIFITQGGSLQFYRRVDTGVAELRKSQGAAVHGDTPERAPQSRGGMLFAEADVEDDEPEIEAARPLGSPAELVDPYNRQAASLLMTEVQRSLDYFAREFPLGDDSMRVLFAVDSPDARDLFDVLQQYLRSDATLASVPEHMAVSDEARRLIEGNQNFRYLTALGLALRGAGGQYADAPALDLAVGDSVVVERRMAPRVMLVSVGASSLVLAGTIIAALVVGHHIAGLQRSLVQHDKALQWISAEHAARVAVLERQATLVKTIQVKDKPMRQVVDFLSASVSGGACLDALSIDSNGSILLSGEAKSSQVVADVMDTVNQSPSLEPVRLNNITRESPESGGHDFKFDLQTGLVMPKTVADSSAPGSAAGAAGAAKGGS